MYRRYKTNLFFLITLFFACGVRTAHGMSSAEYYLGSVKAALIISYNRINRALPGWSGSVLYPRVYAGSYGASVNILEMKEEKRDEDSAHTWSIAQKASESDETFEQRMGLNRQPAFFAPEKPLSEQDGCLGYAWAAALKENHDVIKRECMNMSRDHVPVLQQFVKSTSKQLTPSWNAVPIVYKGMVNCAAYTKAPTLLSLLKAVPGIRAAQLSMLTPGTVLDKHRGTEEFYRTHYGIVVPYPKHGYFSVFKDGKEHRKEWHEGEMFTFNDINKHSAHYSEDAGAPRIVLLIDTQTQEYMCTYPRTLKRLQKEASEQLPSLQAMHAERGGAAMKFEKLILQK